MTSFRPLLKTIVQSERSSWPRDAALDRKITAEVLTQKTNDKSYSKKKMEPDDKYGKSL
jgi:hypothetical protein